MRNVLSVIMLLICFTACSSNRKIPADAQLYQLSYTAWNELNIVGAASVELRYVPDSVGKVMCYIAPEAYDNLKMEVKGSALNIQYKSINNYYSAPYMVIYAPREINSMSITGSGVIKARDCQSSGTLALSICGSGNIDIKRVTAQNSNFSISGSGEIDVDHLTVNQKALFSISGSGEIEADVQAANVSAAVTGSGEIELKGSCSETTLIVTGSGEIDAKKLTSNSVTAKISGSGEISCYNAPNFVAEGKTQNIHRSK